MMDGLVLFGIEKKGMRKEHTWKLDKVRLYFQCPPADTLKRKKKTNELSTPLFSLSLSLPPFLTYTSHIPLPTLTVVTYYHQHDLSLSRNGRND